MKLLQLFRTKKPKRAVVYYVNGRLVIATVQKTTAGLGVENEPCSLAAPFDRADVARSLRRALEASTRAVRHSEQHEWKGGFQPMAKAAGVRSWKTFAETASGAAIDELDGSVRITPYRTLGAKEGFKEIADQRIEVPDLELATAKLLDHFQIDPS